MSKLVVIDGNSIINRAFYAIRMLTNARNVPTNAVLGFLNILFKILDEDKPDYLTVAFDMRAPTFRHLEYDKYKAQRKGMPDELAIQMPILKEILEAMNIKTFEKEGFEADDIIGTISQRCKESDIECYIVTGDKDDLQLAGNGTKIKLTITKGGATETTIYDEIEVQDTFGISPLQFIDLKALAGDKSDNIPGVAGIGEVTALELLKKYGSIENLYEKIDEINIKENVRTKLKNDREMAFVSKRLATIIKDVPVVFEAGDCKVVEFDNGKLFEIFTELGFKAFINKLNLSGQIGQSAKTEEVILKSIELSDLTKLALQDGELFYLLFWEGKRFSVALATSGKSYAYVEANDETIPFLKKLFENYNIKKNGHYIKDDIVFLNSFDIKLKNIAFDSAIAGYVLDPSRQNYDITTLALDILGVSLSVGGKSGGKSTIFNLPQNEAAKLALSYLLELIPLKKEMDKQIYINGQVKLYYDVELPLVSVLADMQICGFKVNKKELGEFSKLLEGKLQELSYHIFLLAGEEFNINSPKQLGNILFEKLNLPVGKKTKTGYSTDSDVLEKLTGKHEIIEIITLHRQYSKLKSTYADGLSAVINPATGKIHTNFNQTVTATGRLSSTEPNLQNIPMKLDLGREIRKMFTATDDDHILVDADYSQIELRVLADISNDETMISAFHDNHDIHTITASQVFGISPDEVTSVMRSRAKAVNFGIVYGIGDYSLSQDLKISRAEAKSYIDNYLSKYSGVKKYMSEIIEKGRKDGFVKTILNRRRYLPELCAQNFITRSFGERMALNTPIQGSAADIIKIAMVNVYSELAKRGLKSKLILQVHDELIIEAEKSELNEVYDILKNEMENAVPLKVPMTVDINSGFSWYDAK